MEQSYPGVYVEAYPEEPRELAGVDKAVIDAGQVAALADRVKQTLGAHLPGWAHRDQGDPGVTLLQLMAWLS